jgi:NAD(P)-dependent dehydrogenase (short-subunit alcohol dehydrogenase family)
VAELVPKDVERALAVCAFAGFLVGQAAAKRMLAQIGSAVPDAARQGRGSAVPDAARQGRGSAVPDAARQGSRTGAIFFTGASASVKGYANSAPFAMGKFALRGLAQSMARELAPKNIHVAHFVIDGGIRGPRHVEQADAPDSMLDPDAIAQNYLNVLKQDRSAWTWEMELRPWVEKF